MADQRLADRARAALHEAEHARVQPAGAPRRVHRLRDQLTATGMRRVALDHHRAPRRQRRGGVAARRGERQRKVRGAEHRHRADRPLHQLQIRARRRLAVGQGLVVAAVEIAAVLDMVGEQAQLAAGAAALAVQPRLGQAGLLHADRGDLGAAGLDLVGDAAQEGGALTARAPAVGGEGVLGGAGGGVDVLRGSCGEDTRLAGGRVGAERLGPSGPFPGDQVFAVQHDASSVQVRAP